MAVSKDPHFAVADAAEVARARENFLSHGKAVERDVSRTILASWQRSRESHIDVDRIVVPYFSDWDGRTPLLASASPVLDALQQQLHDEPVSIILTDNAGLVLDRRVTHHDLLAHLDAVSLAPGFSYAERFAGTNGIGTTISCGEAVLVDGRAHYTQQLGEFSCAGAPIKHPTRRRTLGVLDLTSWAQAQAPAAMLMALAKATARQIEDELLAQTGMRELALFREYMRACKQSGGPVLAINQDAVMMNDHLRLILAADEQQSLTDYAAEMLRSDGRAAARTVELSSGRTAHLRCTPVDGHPQGRAGAVFRVRLLHGDAPRPLVPAATRGTQSAPSPPGLVGTSSTWLRCVQQVNSCYQTGECITLDGEPGTGKRSLLRAVHLQHHPTHGFRILEPPDRGDDAAWISSLTDALAAPAVMVVVTHAGRLGAAAAQALAGHVLDLASDDDPGRHVRIAITTTPAELVADELATAFPRTVDVPPLRHHIADLPDLAAHLLIQIAGADRLTISSEALAQLGRLDWPDNITQLRKMLATIVRHHRSGVITVDDLPPEARARAHRRLTQMEALERDAIVQALLDNDGNPGQAASALGISRATIYRKIRQFGITLPLSR